MVRTCELCRFGWNQLAARTCADANQTVSIWFRSSADRPKLDTKCSNCCACVYKCVLQCIVDMSIFYLPANTLLLLLSCVLLLLSCVMMCVVLLMS